jgi:hypothetical membrane protein
MEKKEKEKLIARILGLGWISLGLVGIWVKDYRFELIGTSLFCFFLLLLIAIAEVGEDRKKKLKKLERAYEGIESK